MFYFSHILAYGLYHTEEWSSDYTQHGLVDALLQHIAKFILDVFSAVSSKTAFLYMLSQQRVVFTGSRGGQKPLLSAKRTCTIIFLNPNINPASFKITLDNQQGTNTQDDCFAQCNRVEQIQKDSPQLFPLLQSSCLNGERRFLPPEQRQSSPVQNRETTTNATRLRSVNASKVLKHPFFWQCRTCRKRLEHIQPRRSADCSFVLRCALPFCSTDSYFLVPMNCQHMLDHDACDTVAD